MSTEQKRNFFLNENDLLGRSEAIFRYRWAHAKFNIIRFNA